MDFERIFPVEQLQPHVGDIVTDQYARRHGALYITQVTHAVGRLGTDSNVSA